MAVVLDSGVSLVGVSEESHIALVCDKSIYDRGSSSEHFILGPVCDFDVFIFLLLFVSACSHFICL